ncbi:MAG TPA: PKD domain-containing protein [Puia sp.]|nr:PKD domain-containing protein [Puia sp.]
MQSCKRFLKYLLCYCLIVCANKNAVCQNYIFAQLNGTPVNTLGWNLQGDATIANVTGTGDSELLICPAILNSSGAVFYNQPINLSMCNRWKAEFDFRMFDGTGADGIAFCFLDVPPSGYVTGGGLGIPNTANGLKICFDTWNNCIPYDPSTVHQDMPKIEIRWGVGYNDNTYPNNIISGECLNQPTRDNADGKISFLRSSSYNHAKITYDSGNIQVFVNDSLYLSGYQQFNFAGYLGFTASTGGYSDNHSIKNVVIYTQMPPSFAGNPLSFCPYDTVQLGGASNPTYSYSWYPSTGLNDPTVSSPLLHIPNDSSDFELHTYYVKTSFKNNPGCASVDSVALQVYPNPKVHFITPEICLTDAIAQFQDSSFTADLATLPFSYQWRFGDPNSQPSNPNNSSVQNPAHHYSAAMNYPVSLIVTSSKGCIDSTTKIFTVNGAVPKAGFSVSNASGLCSNKLVTLTNESSVDFGSITKVQIFWGDTLAVSYTDDNPFPGKVYSHSYPNPVTGNVSTYLVRMLSSSGITCENETDQQITIQPSPHVQFSAIPVVCDYAPPYNITEAIELTNAPGSFVFFGKGLSSDGLLDPKQAGVGIDTLLYTYTGANGCRDSAFQTVNILAPPDVNAGNDTSVVINQPLQLQAVSTDMNGDSFGWSPITGLSDPGIANPVSTLGPNMDSIRYTVTATDSAGCYGQASVEVKVFNTIPDIFVPNAFTPGKTSNNIFKPIPVGISSMRFFRVYNRWGQLVYSTSRMGDGWDGTLLGKPQDAGSYVWMVQGTTYTGKIIYKKGTMTLVR